MIARQDNSENIIEAFKLRTKSAMSFTKFGDPLGISLESSLQTQRALDSGAVGLF
jgi:penicillin-binding protein 1A